jgi:hypothetical protein
VEKATRYTRITGFASIARRELGYTTGRMEPAPLEWEITPSGVETRVRLLGRLDGHGRLVTALAPLLTDTRILFDASGIRRISSPGVAEWIQFLEALDKRTIAYEIERCSLAFVQQLNMISIFRGRGVVRSFHAPYFCPACDKSLVKLIAVDEDSERNLATCPPCPLCAQPTEFDDERSSFLAFLNRRSGY